MVSKVPPFAVRDRGDLGGVLSISRHAGKRTVRVPPGHFQLLIHSTRPFRNPLPDYLHKILVLVRPKRTALACEPRGVYSPPRSGTAIKTEAEVFPLSKWFWCGALAIVLAAGAAAAKKFWWSAGSPAVGAQRRAPAPEQWNPPKNDVRSENSPLPPDLTALDELAAVHEPIPTRPELLESTRETTEPLPASAGAEECAASATRMPRPDRETRRMPYADDVDHHEFAGLLFSMRNSYTSGAWNLTPYTVREPADLHSLAGIVHWALQLRQRDATVAEESEEPPLLDPAPPHDRQPPHCPFGGYCPYPGSQRHLPPR